MFRKIQIIALVMGISAMAHTSKADMDNAPGSMCVATSGTVSVNTAGQAYNDTSSAMTVICPSERKTISGKFTTKLKGVVWVMDQNSSSNVCCRVMSRNPSGTNVTGTEVCSSGSSSSYQQLTLPEITDTYTWSHFYVRCSIPAKSSSSTSRILTYRAEQN